MYRRDGVEAAPPANLLFGFVGGRETRLMLRDPDSRLIGCVAFEPQRCGQELVQSAQRTIEGKAVPGAPSSVTKS